MPDAYHRPVLVDEVCEALRPALAGGGGGGIVVDCTLGGGGHSEAILRRLGPAALLGLDRDPDAIAHAGGRLAEFSAEGRFRAFHAPFSTLAEVLADAGIAAVTAILADLGVSSHQLDTGARGFSFQADAPLDMRMDPTRGESAAAVLASIDARTLAGVLRDLGEEPDADRIAAAIAATRPTTTGALAEVVAAAMSAPRRRQLGARIHPATRTFMALRILVNHELEELDRFLEDAPELLGVGGRIGVITFHSLEDRAVKRRFAALAQAPAPPRGVPIPASELPQARFVIPPGARQGVTAGDAEVAENPRSRSARLRVLERRA
ncbi:MAG: 16S rRNA (cytosine(1402)-N(4))-methyltransferase RsmH [Nannocystaceae bacterium]